MNMQSDAAIVSIAKMKKSRNDLTLQDKVKALEALDKRMPQTEVARCLGCSQSQISRIASRRESILSLWKLAPQNTGRKRMKKNYDIESKLRDWFCAMANENTVIPLSIIQEQAVSIARTFHRPGFVPTKDWLHCWKGNFKIGSRFRKMCEDSLNTIQHGDGYGTSNTEIEMSESDSKANIELINSMVHSTEEVENAQTYENEMEHAETFQTPQFPFNEVARDDGLYNTIKIKEEPVEVEESIEDQQTCLELNYFVENASTSVSSADKEDQSPSNSHFVSSPIKVEHNKLNVMQIDPQFSTRNSEYKVKLSLGNNITCTSKQSNYTCTEETSNKKSMDLGSSPSSGAALEAVATIRKFLQSKGHEDFMCLDEVEEHVVDCIRITAAISPDHESA